MSFVSTKNFRGRSTKFATEKNDCSVVSISNAFGVSYEEAHEFCRVFGEREERGGVNAWRLFALALKKGEMFGQRIEKIKFPYYDYERACISTEKVQSEWGEWYLKKKFSPRTTVKKFMEMYPKGRFVIVISGHMFAIKDGVPYDYKDPRWCEVEYVIKVS